MSTKETDIDRRDRRGRRLVLVRLQKQAEMRKLYVARIPRWRHPFVGYISAVPLVGLTLLGVMWEQRMLPHYYFSGGPLFLAVMLITLIWGVGPAIFAAILSALAIIYFYVLPPGTFDISDWNSLIAILPFFASGIIIAVITSQRESARRRALFAEQEEQERAGELEATFEAITDAIIVYDLQGRILRTNAAARELFALDSEQPKPRFLSFLRRQRPDEKPALVILDEHGQFLPIEQFPLSRILRGEELTHANAMDMVLRARDGQEVHLNVTGASVYNSEGQLAGAVCVFRDVTERRELERRTHDTLNALLEMAEAVVRVPDDTSLKDEDLLSTSVGKYTPTAANEAARRLAELIRSIMGCRRVGIVAIDPDTDLLRPVGVVGLTPEQEEHWWTSQQQYTRLSDSPYPDFVARLRANEVQVLNMMQPPYSNQPNPYGIRTLLIAAMFVADHLVGTLALDYGDTEHKFSAEEIVLAGAVAKLAALVIERERLLYERAQSRANELALREAKRRMDEFLGMAGHELRTPLTTIKGNIQLAKRQLKKSFPQNGTDANQSSTDLPEKLKLVEELLERAERQVRLQNRLVSDLLDVSRIQADKMELHTEPCDLATIVRDAVQDQRQLAPTRTIDLKLPDGPVPVVADVDRIGQVVTNYLTNALKYSAADRPVEVSLSSRGGGGVEEGGDHVRDTSPHDTSGGYSTGRPMAKVSVRDQGPGLTEEEQRYIWERFHQIERIKEQSGSSSGLGLGLHICRSIIERHQGQVGVQSAPGEGSTFWFTLPLPLTNPA